ncbi:DUF3999 domain-containing protein [Intestinirhabdus alba]|jgi:hypothetical protein|uniref:DUF3999 family protein n=1 Tax=Intestinirhabdus alba TaxID=2899544 RepID=A0A6L6IKK2_9ENTR|nr:DUF3999 domain-containing protein [Intestinirhabdus alba]MTH46238.1 DUF3999 family protein [Intestinirhabdus alba]
MKWINAVVCSLLLGAVGMAYGDDAPVETPQDYGYGRVLKTYGDARWYRLPLPPEVYLQTAHADLRDVRVFNREGETVPFTLQKQQEQAADSRSVSLSFFPFEASPALRPSEKSGDRATLLLRGPNGTEIHFESENAQAVGQSYLLTLPKGVTKTPRLSQLRLEWETPTENWQGKASLYLSRNLKHWTLLERNTPLMSLTHGGERLKMDTLGVDNVSLSDDGVRWLLLILDSQSPPLSLKGVSGIPQREPSLTRPVPMVAEGQRVSPGEAIWRWPRPQPLTALNITLPGEGVLPVELEWRGEEKGPWRPLARTMLYNLQSQYSPAISLSGERVEAIRMTTVSARLPEQLPTVSGERDGYQLIFNAQGKGPYLVTWGNGAAGAASVSLDMLIPPALRNTVDVDALSLALVTEPVALGGEARLSATSAAEQRSRWKTQLVWAVLVFGVLLLAGMAYRLWQDVNRQGGGE